MVVLPFVLLLAYFLPLIVAISRKAPDVGAVIVIDLFLGWTGIGWFVAMAMALRSPRPPQQINVIQQVVGNPAYGYGPVGYGGPGYAPPGYPQGQFPGGQYWSGTAQQHGQPDSQPGTAGYPPAPFQVTSVVQLGAGEPPTQWIRQAGPQQPGYRQPGYQQPGYQRPDYGQPGDQRPGLGGTEQWDALGRSCTEPIGGRYVYRPDALRWPGPVPAADEDER